VPTEVQDRCCRQVSWPCRAGNGRALAEQEVSAGNSEVPNGAARRAPDLAVQDAEAFGDSTASAAIDRSLTPRPLDELRILEEGGTTLGLLLARNRPVFWGGRPVPVPGPCTRRTPAALEFLEAMHAGPKPWSPDFS
jgi:hypothetical protein